MKLKIISHFSLLLCTSFYSIFTMGQILDETFGTDGVVYTSFALSTATPLAIDIQTDGKILVVGTNYSAGDLSTSKSIIARYNYDGSLDNTFSDDGKASFDLVLGGDEVINSIQELADGSILLGGSKIFKINHFGEIDSSFGIMGISENFEGVCKSLVLLADGKIIMAAGSSGETQSSYPYIYKFLSNGFIDTTFGVNGILSNVAIDGFNSGIDLILNTDGKIIIGGQYFPDGSKCVSVAKFTVDGLIDSTFGPSGDGIFGSVTYCLTGPLSFQSVNETPDNGYIIRFKGSGFLKLLKLTENGDIDFAFGDEGVQTFDVSTDNQVYHNSVEVQPDGKYLFLKNMNVDNSDIAIYRVNVDGSMDNTFNATGIVDFQSDLFYTVGGLIFGNDAKIYVFAEASDFSIHYFTILRYLSGLTNITESVSNNQINVVPNPVVDIGSFNLVGSNYPVNYSLYTIDGRLIASNILQSKESIDVTELKVGVYIVKGIDADNIAFTLKVIKM